jgi:hypothetical protein
MSFKTRVRSFGACVIIAARRALWCLYFLGHLMARRIMKKSAYAAGLWPMETLDASCDLSFAQLLQTASNRPTTFNSQICKGRTDKREPVK